MSCRCVDSNLLSTKYALSLLLLLLLLLLSAVLVGECFIPLDKYKNKWGKVLKGWLPLHCNGEKVKPQIFVELKHKYQGGDSKPKCNNCFC
jgi:hypothetical protein